MICQTTVTSKTVAIIINSPNNPTGVVYNEETIKNRLAVYYQKTKPVLDYYVKQDLVKDVPGVGNIDEIFANIKKVLGEF